MPVTGRKNERIDVRVTAAAKETLQRAAALSHKNVSEFLLDAGLQAASESLADRRLFELGEADWQAFQEILDRPVEHKPRLARLLTEPGALD
jgi:uncharacterized protein (DUF1778 family)